MCLKKIGSLINSLREKNSHENYNEKKYYIRYIALFFVFVAEQLFLVIRGPPVDSQGGAGRGQEYFWNK